MNKVEYYYENESFLIVLYYNLQGEIIAAYIGCSFKFNLKLALKSRL
jgi:hypothetical protein